MASEELKELMQIRQYLSILTYETRAKVMLAFEREVLRTDRRIAMFKLFDGARTPSQVGELVDVTSQGVRDLIKDLAERDFVEIHVAGGAQIATANMESILRWYYSLSESRR